MDCSCQVPLPTGFSRQEYWRGVPFPTPGHLPDPGIETKSLAPPALAGGFFTTCTTWETLWYPTYQYLHLLSSISSVLLLFLVAQSYLTLLYQGLTLRALWDFPWRNFPWSGPWDFPGKNTGVGCHFFLQRIFPTQGLNPGLLHCRWNPYPLNHQGCTACARKE